MPRRFFALLAALLVLLTALPAHAGEIGDLAILSQWDERFFDNSFRYSNNYFRFGGCGPASASNGVIAALDVTDQDLAAEVLRDVMNLLTKFSPVKNKIQVTWLNYLDFTREQLAAGAGDERYPALNQALRNYGGDIHYLEGFVNAETLAPLLPDPGSGPVIFHGSFNGNDRWANLREIIRVLTDAGYEDARFVLSVLGAGTEVTKSPFRSGTAGHYLCVCVSMKSFCETGELYVLDSLPRALAGEEFGADMTPYHLQYDFLKRQKFSTSLDEFNELFTVERVQPTIVRAMPIGEALEAVNAASGTDTLPLDALMPYLNRVMQFHGSSHIFVVLPQR